MSAGSRTLFVSHEATLSGAPMQLLHLARWWQARGRDFTVALPEKGPLLDLLEAAGVATVLDEELLRDWEHRSLRRLARDHDLVVANSILSWGAVRAAFREEKQSLWYVHETLVVPEMIRRIPEIGETLLRPSLIVVPTVRAGYMFAPLTPRPVRVIPYGIPAPACAGSETEKERTTFLLLGSFEPRKGQDLFLEAVAALPADVRGRAAFSMAGRVLDESFYKEVETRARSLDAKILGALDHGAALEALSATDVLVCASRDEAMPISILEAMALGRAVIATDVGGISESIRHGLNGLMVPAESPSKLAEAMLACIRDDKGRRELGAVARRTFQLRHGIDRFGRDFDEALAETMTAPGGAGEEGDEAYARWLALYSRPTPGSRREMRRHLRGLRRHPLVSIILPVFDPPPEVLQAALESVRRQSYRNWELCIADDASTDKRIRPLLEKFAREEPRVRLAFRTTNGHISACSNTALEQATGEWCALLDHDDELHEDALAWAMREAGAHAEAGLIYTDQDSVDRQERRSNPFFKTEWDPLLFLGQNFINHLGLYRTALVREIGGFREGYEGSQDYDLALRCLERLRPDQVRHIPRVLYHWRMVPGSVADSREAKPYAREAARRALSDHLARRKIAGRVVPCPQSDDSHRVIFDLPPELPSVSVVLPTRNKAALLRQCLATLRERTDYPGVEIVIVDHESTEPEARELLEAAGREPRTQILRATGTFNYSRLNNLGARAARGDLILFLNNDVEGRDPGWLRELVSQLLQPGVGAAGARLVYPDGTLQHAGVLLGYGGVAGHYYYKLPRDHPGYFNRAWLHRDCSAVTAACLLIRGPLFLELGGFDEKNLPVDFNDVDLCLRVRAAGWRIVWTPYAELVHHESASRGRNRPHGEVMQLLQEARYMQERWGVELLRDPYYTPNFSLAPPGFQLAFPPRFDWVTGGAGGSGARSL